MAACVPAGPRVQVSPAHILRLIADNKRGARRAPLLFYSFFSFLVLFSYYVILLLFYCVCITLSSLFLFRFLVLLFFWLLFFVLLLLLFCFFFSLLLLFLLSSLGYSDHQGNEDNQHADAGHHQGKGEVLHEGTIGIL